MATRFYFTSSTTTPPYAPNYASWTRTADAVRRWMSTTKDGSAMVSRPMWAGTSPAANGSALNTQWHSLPLAVGTVFSTTDTIKMVVRAQESAANDNVDRTPICLRVYGNPGGNLRATLKALGHYGPNQTEWNSSLRNKQAADGDTLDVNYTTVAGDYLVLEVGGQVSSAGGASVTANMSWGSNSATDLAENETGTAADNPWFEISNNLAFVPSFPTTSVLDDFSGTAGNPVVDSRPAVPSGQTWTAPTVFPGMGSGELTIESSTSRAAGAAGAASATLSGVYSRASNPVEAFVTLPVYSSWAGLVWGVSDPALGSLDGYWIQCYAGYQVNCYRADNGGLSIVGSDLPGVFVSGDQMGIRHHPDGTIHLFRNGLLILQLSDNTYVEGRIGMYADGTGERLDNFGGGGDEVIGPQTHLGAATLAGTVVISATAQTGTVREATATLAGSATISATGSVPATHLAVATLAGTSTTTATGRLQHEAAATLAGTSGGLKTGTVTRLGTATIAGAGSATVVGTVTRLGASTVTSQGAVSATAAATRQAAATLAGTGVVNATGQSGPAAITHEGSAVLAGSSTGTGTGQMTRLGAATIRVAAALGATYGTAVYGVAIYGPLVTLGVTATGTVTGLASTLLAGQGSVSAQAQATRLATALLTGQGVVNATGTVAGATSAATISGTSNFVINGITGGGYVPPRVTSVTPAGGGVVVSVTWTASQPASSPYYYLEVGLNGPGGGLYGFDALSPTSVYIPANDTWTYYFTVQARVGGQWQDFYGNPYLYDSSPRQAQSTLGGSGVVSASAGVTRPAQATLAGTGTVVAVGSVSGVQDGAATLAGTGAVLATGTRTVSATALLNGQGAVAPTGQVTRLAATVLAGAGTVSATGRREAQAVATLVGTSTVVATGTVQQAALLGAAIIAGTATVTATGAVASVRLGSATLAGTSTVLAVGTVQHQLLGIATIAGRATVFATGKVEHRSYGDTGGRETLFELLSWDGLDVLVGYAATQDFLQLVE